MANEKKQKFDFIQPIKDIPNVFKGFPKNIVHIIKDPVKSSAEVEPRRKEIYPFLYIFGFLTLIMVILMAIFSDAQDIFMTIGMVFGLGVAGCAFLLLVLKKAAEKFGDIECGECGKRITYGPNVQYRVIDNKYTVTTKTHKIEKDGIPTGATITVSGKEKIIVEVHCKCQECGTEKTFTHEFVSAEIEKSAVKVPWRQNPSTGHLIHEEMLAGFKNDLDELGKQDGLICEMSLPKDVKVKYSRLPGGLVAGYFGDEIQIR